MGGASYLPYLEVGWHSINATNNESSPRLAQPRWETLARGRADEKRPLGLVRERRKVGSEFVRAKLLPRPKADAGFAHGTLGAQISDCVGHSA